MIALLALALAPVATARAQQPLTGRWELAYVTNAGGAVGRPDTRFALYITHTRGDSLFGRALMYGDRNNAPVDWVCGELRGASVQGGRLTMVIVTTDQRASDVLFSAGVRSDSMFAVGLRLRSGQRFFSLGTAVAFARVTTDTALACALEISPFKPGAVARVDSLPAAERLFEAAVDVGPKMISCPPVLYPQSVQLAGIQGQVLIQFVVDTLGRPMPPTLKVAATPHDSLTRPALEMVVGCRFTPGRVRGRAVKVLVTLPGRLLDQGKTRHHHQSLPNQDTAEHPVRSVAVDDEGTEVNLCGVPVEALSRRLFTLWQSNECPLCRAGTPLEDP